MVEPVVPEERTRLSPLCPQSIDRPVMRQTWRDVTFAHWPVAIDDVQAILPAGLEVDVLEGRAWVSLVGFEVDGLRIRGLPAVPTTSRFEEFNVRTYVIGPEGPGVWFCSLDVAHWLPVLVARVGFALPYDKGRVEVRHEGDEVTWRVERTWPERVTGSLSVRRPDLAVDGGPVVDDDLAVFLTARWRLYASTRGGRLVTAPVEHDPWPLHHAELLDVDTGLVAAAGLAVSGTPIVHHASRVSARVGRPRLLARVVAPVEPLVVWFDDDCGVCSASVRFLSGRTDDSVVYRPNRELDVADLGAEAADAIVVTDRVGRWSAVDAVAAVLDRSGRTGRIAGRLLRLPGIHGAAGIVYRSVAANRARISARLGLAAGCEISPRDGPPG